jgi:DNA-binding LacI/PurR family transcriptional regulator
MPTLLDISRKTGLSVATVSNTLNGRPGYSKATQLLVQRTAKELGYTANPLALGLLGKSTRTIGLLWSLGGPHSAEGMARDIALRMQHRGYVTHLTDSLSDPDVVGRQLADYRRRGVDAVVIQYESGVVTEEICRQLKGFSAAVAVGPVEPFDEIDWIHHDMPNGYRQAVNHLADSKRTRPALLVHAAVADHKIKAFLEQCRELGMDVSDRSIINFPANGIHKQFASLCRQSLDERFSREFPFDSLICQCDELAAAAIAWLRERGVRVPEDVAVIGCNNAMLAESLWPPLASIERHDEKVADEIEKLVFSRLDDSDLPARRRNVQSQFIWRESAGKRLSPKTNVKLSGGL